MASPLRDRSRSPRFYASRQDNLGTQVTGCAGSSRVLQRGNSGNYGGLSYDGYSSNSGTYSCRSPGAFSGFNYRLPCSGGPRARSPDWFVTQQKEALSLNGPARSGGSSSRYNSSITILPAYLPRPRARAPPTSCYSLNSSRTILSGEWPGPVPRGREYRSHSAPRSYTPTVYAGYAPSPETVLGIPPKPMTRPTLPSAGSGSPTYLSLPRLARPPSPLAAERRIYALDLMGGGPRRVATGTSRLVGSGDLFRTESRSLSPGFADAYIAQARREDSDPARSIVSEELRAARRARVAQLAQAAASCEAAQGLPALPRHAPHRDVIPSSIRRRENTAQSLFYSVEEQERRDLDHAAGLFSQGESRVPFRYPRQEPYQLYRYSSGPSYGERAFCPRRPRNGFNWEDYPSDSHFSDAPEHFAGDRGSGPRVDRGRRCVRFRDFTNHPHFRSIAVDLRSCVGGRRRVNPIPRGTNPRVQDQNF